MLLIATFYDFMCLRIVLVFALLSSFFTLPIIAARYARCVLGTQCWYWRRSSPEGSPKHVIHGKVCRGKLTSQRKRRMREKVWKSAKTVWNVRSFHRQEYDLFCILTKSCGLNERFMYRVRKHTRQQVPCGLLPRGSDGSGEGKGTPRVERRSDPSHLRHHCLRHG